MKTKQFPGSIPMDLLMHIKVLYVFSDMECGVGGEGSGVCGAVRV